MKFSIHIFILFLSYFFYLNITYSQPPVLVFSIDPIDSSYLFNLGYTEKTYSFSSKQTLLELKSLLLESKKNHLQTLQILKQEYKDDINKQEIVEKEIEETQKEIEKTQKEIEEIQKEIEEIQKDFEDKKIKMLVWNNHESSDLMLRSELNIKEIYNKSESHLQVGTRKIELKSTIIESFTPFKLHKKLKNYLDSVGFFGHVIIYDNFDINFNSEQRQFFDTRTGKINSSLQPETKTSPSTFPASITIFSSPDSTKTKYAVKTNNSVINEIRGLLNVKWEIKYSFIIQIFKNLPDFGEIHIYIDLKEKRSEQKNWENYNISNDFSIESIPLINEKYKTLDRLVNNFVNSQK